MREDLVNAESLVNFHKPMATSLPWIHRPSCDIILLWQKVFCGQRDELGPPQRMVGGKRWSFRNALGTILGP